MGFTLGVLAVSAGVGFGASELINSQTSKTKLPDQPPLPDPNAANKSASATVKDQRETMLASGGITDYTGGLGILTGSDISKTTLLGG